MYSHRKQVKLLFDNPRQRSTRTDPDYVEHQIEKMVDALFNLNAAHRLTYFQGLDYKDRGAVLARLRSWPKAEAVRILLDEAERCLEKASAPHGAAGVTGKALDLLLHLLGLDLKGTLGQKLNALKKIARCNPLLIDSQMGRPLVAELLRMWSFLETRNSAAHFRTQKPEISLTEAAAFTKKVFQLYEMEKQRQSSLANELQFQSRRKGIVLKQSRSFFRS